MPRRINIGRKFSGGACDGLFGNPVTERTVSQHYRTYFRKLIDTHPDECLWLLRELKNGAVLYCPGCGIGSPTCHARIIEEELLDAPHPDTPPPSKGTSTK